MLSNSCFATSSEVRPPQTGSKKQIAMNGISLPCSFLVRVAEHTPGHPKSGPFPCETQWFCESQSPPPHSSTNRSSVWKRTRETLLYVFTWACKRAEYYVFQYSTTASSSNLSYTAFNNFFCIIKSSFLKLHCINNTLYWDLHGQTYVPFS